MFRLQQIAIGGFSAYLALWYVPATAQTIASFGIPLHATLIDGNKGTQVSTVGLNGTGTHNFAFTFVLPRDYTNNTEVSIVVLLFPAFGTPPCSMRLVPAQMTRRRADAALVNSLDGVRGGSATVDFSSGVHLNKTFKIAPSGALIDLKRGDAIGLEIRREADDAEDTCGSVFISGVDVRYDPL